MKSFGAVKIWDERPEWLILSHPNHDSDRFRSTQSAVILPITQSTSINDLFSVCLDLPSGNLT